MTPRCTIRLACMSLLVVAFPLAAASCGGNTSSTSGGGDGGGADATGHHDAGAAGDSSGGGGDVTVEAGPGDAAPEAAPEAGAEAGPGEGGADVSAQDGPAPEAAADTGSGDTGSSDAEGDAHEAGPDPCATAPTTDFYVDATSGSDSNNGGSPGCAFKTITAALAASAGAAFTNSTIHLAAGTYAAGETFPLVVDRGRSLVGAGAATTTIQGSSAAYKTTGTGSFLDTGTNYVTILAGDVMGGANALGATTLSGFTVLPAASVTTVQATSYFGITCIAGNAPNVGATLPLPTPSLLVHGVTVGPNFAYGMALGYEATQPTACNALVTGSTFTGCTTGVETGTCGTTNPVSSWPSAQIGDGVAGVGNTFSSSVIDLLGGGCGSVTTIDYDQFVSGYRGVVIISQAAQYFELLHDSFDGTAGPLPMGLGLQTSASVVISKLDDNTFTNISESAGADTAAQQTTGYAIEIAAVKEALRNSVHDNDIGLFFGAAPGTFDFSSGGTAANANQIYCNSKTVGGNGYDVVLAYTGAGGPNLSGDVFDHVPPSTGASTTASPNGTDVVGTPTATLTGATAIAGSVTCATGRTH